MRVLSGIKTSGAGELHIGNYIGAIKQFVELQKSNEVFYMLANLHAITVPHDPSVVRENVYKVAALYLALGVDPQKATIFVQSLVPEHTELAWLLNTIASMGELRRMTQFKDKAGEDHESVSVGLFDYPVLMAADILLYQANVVPVGEDQKQHLELIRNLAERFNKRFGHTFTVPAPYMPDRAARIMGLDDPSKKMSKSLGVNNYISLLDEAPKIREKLQKTVTDSDNQVRYDPAKKPAISNLLVIFAAMSDRSIKELEKDYAASGYSKFKVNLADALIAFLKPIQAEYKRLIKDRAELERVLKQGSTNAQIVAAQTLRIAKDKMGIL